MAEILLNSICSTVATGDMAYRWLQALAFPTISVSREPGRSCLAFSDLTLKVTSIISATLLVKLVTKAHPDSREGFKELASQWENQTMCAH